MGVCRPPSLKDRTSAISISCRTVTGMAVTADLKGSGMGAALRQNSKALRVVLVALRPPELLIGEETVRGQ
jgi:hypothetical protein